MGCAMLKLSECMKIFKSSKKVVPADPQLPVEFTTEYHDMIDANRKILDEAGLYKNGVITDVVRDFWLMAKESGYDDIKDDYVGLHIARCLNRMARKYGYKRI